MIGNAVKLPGIPEFAHIGYVVNDIEKYMKTTGELFGISHFDVYDYIPSEAKVNGKKVECHFKIAMGASETSGVKVEIICPIKGGIPQMDFVNECGAGLHHVAFSVEDYDKCYEAFSSMDGCVFLFEADAKDEIRGRRRSFYARLADMAGIVEITEKPVLIK
jgi:hypothetical protein